MTYVPVTRQGRETIAFVRSKMPTEWKKLRHAFPLEKHYKCALALAEKSPELVEMEKRGGHSRKGILWIRSKESPVPTYEEALVQYEELSHKKG